MAQPFTPASPTFEGITPELDLVQAHPVVEELMTTPTELGLTFSWKDYITERTMDELAGLGTGSCDSLVTFSGGTQEQTRLFRLLYGIQMYRGADDFRAFVFGIYNLSSVRDRNEAIAKALVFGRSRSKNPDYQEWYRHFVTQTATLVHEGVAGGHENSLQYPETRDSWVDGMVRRVYAPAPLGHSKLYKSI